MKNKRGFSVVVLIIILAVLAGSGYFVWKNQTSDNSFTTAPAPTAGVDTSTWKTYRNDKYGFEFRYPPDYILKVKVLASEIPPGFSDVQSSRDVRIFSDESTKILTFGVDIKEYISGDLVDDNDFGSNENLYDLAFYGNGDLFKKILSTFRFTK